MWIKSKLKPNLLIESKLRNKVLQSNLHTFYIISAPVCFKFNLTIIETNYIIDMDYRFHEISADRLHRMSFRMQAKAAYSNIC